MIVSFLMGGLGNQMFQYAFGRSLSLDLSTKLYLDNRFYHIQSGVTPRKFSLDSFQNISINFFPNNLETLTDEFNKQTIKLLETNFAHNNFHTSNRNNYFLEGYWQTEKYFIHNKARILKDFCYTDDWSIKTFKKYPQLNSNTTSMHFRRTDYLHLQKSHPVQKIEYYDKAVEHIGQYDNLLIFSDDIDWCKKNLKYKNMCFIENETDIDSLWIMSLCQNNIIANSSFSWWAAWLNRNKSKTVVAPKNWFGPEKNLSTEDLIPENWSKI